MRDERGPGSPPSDVNRPPVTRSRRLTLATEKMVRALESRDRPLLNAFVTFIAVTQLRTFAEVFSTGVWAMTTVNLAHFTLFYASLAACVIIVVALAGRGCVESTARVVLPGFIVLLLTPTIDLVLFWGQTAHITYFQPGMHDDLLRRFLTLGGTFHDSAVSPGMKLEIVAALAMLGGYVFIKSHSLARALLAAAGVYAVAFLHGMLPYFTHWTLGLGHPDSPGGPRAGVYAACWLLALIPEAIVLLLLAAPSRFWLFVKDSRPLRVLHFELMLLLGVVLGVRTIGRPPVYLLMPSMLLSAVALFLAALFCIVINNVYDIEIDRVSNADRPLVRGAISQSAYTRLGWIFCGLALLYAMVAGPATVLAVCVCMGTYFLYSAPPFRLKRVPLLSKLVISINSFAVVVLGWGLTGGYWSSVPRWVAAFLLLGFTLAANFIDLKDYEGDRLQGIKTLPVLIGLQPARILIGAFFAGNYLAAALFLSGNQKAILALAVLGVLQILLLTTGPYQEGPVFATYLVSILFIIAYLGWQAPPSFFTGAPPGAESAPLLGVTPRG
jgi:4-hydroxybenzoate polyprenyltransferase